MRSFLNRMKIRNRRGRDYFLSLAFQGPKVSFSHQICDLNFTSETEAPGTPGGCCHLPVSREGDHQGWRVLY